VSGPPFSTIEEALEDIRDGRMVVVCDAEDRENEGDLTLAAQFATPEAINFMATHGRGLICLALTPDRCDELGLDLMAAKNESPFQTAFTVSVEAREGITTGISAHDRAHTVQLAIDPNTRPQDLVQPGHIFPLKAKRGGVLERTGQTEAAVDLARLAGLNPSGVICEVMNDDGTMARVPDLEGYCAKHGLKMITVADLIAYRRRHDKLVERVVEANLPTKFGDFTVVGFRSLVDDKHHVATRCAVTAASSSRTRWRASRPRGRACCSTSRRRDAASACSTSCGPTGSRSRVATPSTPTWSSGCPPTCATTASAPRSSSTSG
jgi:3,4-dihydroxy 2-butanone 4-phosphate synthase / GTP cyclohydrolase II